MRLVRIRTGTDAVWGVVRDDAVHVLEGDPYGAPQESGDVLALAEVALLAPVTPSKILCLGRNYEAHRQEMGLAHLGAPSIFMKPPTTVVGPGADVVLPPTSLSERVEHEAELAVVIGRPTRWVSPEEALDHVLGFTCADDVSARDLQRSDPQVTRGKGFDTFCPVGPWIETELDLAAGTTVRCRVNGELRQEGATSDMTYDVPFLISHISQFTTLLPGDLLLTGSPGGTGPLVAGDQVEIDIDGVGVLRHGVVAAP